MLTKDKIFCIADDFCNEFDMEAKKGTGLIDSNDGKAHRNRFCTMSDNEMTTILLCFHFGGFRNFKHYYLHCVGEHLKSEFPDRLSYNRLIQLEHRIMIPLLLFLKLICFGECTGITFVDSTKIVVCNNKRISTNKVFKYLAEIGKSSMGWFLIRINQLTF